jgi:hypothetical protein
MKRLEDRLETSYLAPAGSSSKACSAAFVDKEKPIPALNTIPRIPSIMLMPIIAGEIT